MSDARNGEGGAVPTPSPSSQPKRRYYAHAFGSHGDGSYRAVIMDRVTGHEVAEAVDIDSAKAWADRRNRQSSETYTLAELDGTDDEASWLTEGHVLDAQEVEWLRALRIVATA